MRKQILALEKKLNESSNSNLALSGVNSGQWALVFKHYLLNSEQVNLKKNIFVFSDEIIAENFFNLIKHSTKTLFYPDLGSDIYSSITPSEFNLSRRFAICNFLANNNVDELSIVTTVSALNLFVPPKDFFLGNELVIQVSDIHNQNELATKLATIGYKRTPTIEEPGTFSIKGEIFDIYPTEGSPVRLQYFDDMVEEIHCVNKHTLLTERDKSLELIKLEATQYSLLDRSNINSFRKNFPRPPISEKERFSYREQVLKGLSNKHFFDDYPLFISYFHEEKSTIDNFLDDFKFHIIDEFNINQTPEHSKASSSEAFDEYSKSEFDIIKPRPEDVYNFDFQFPQGSIFINDVDVSIDLDLEQNYQANIQIKLTPVRTCISQLKSKHPDQSKMALLSLFIQNSLLDSNSVLLFYSNDKSLNEIKHILKIHLDHEHLLSRVHFINEHLDEGFLYDHEKLVFLSENDFFEKKLKKVKYREPQVDEDLFAEQLATLQIDDFVIHKDYGVGQYKGMETLDIGGSVSDFLVLEYKDQDKVYVPVYKLSLLQKHSTRTNSVPLANLKSKKFEQAKAKAKSSVKKLAFDLLELHAKRKMQKGYAFTRPDHSYEEFALSFKFQETPDQARAIDNVIHDMVSDRPMDRLVCGDVGFGKTEVAMRAAFKAVLDHKQVAILVPTTVLALQHYNSFTERFKNVAVEIDFISRFKSPKETRVVLDKLAEGKIDILIGTHKLLSEKVKFNDIGLLIIDEEQRFGVGHKEKLKLLRESVDTLTLTATPIPRTLQMSFLGIKELSIIKTPPPRRQTIKSYVIKEDLKTLKLAIDKELSRGGQVFIVHNKVSDIEIYTSKIRELVPTARIIFAHGQLPERELEKRISDFYKYKYDILISTTIIESGIDIARANTMIIDRADNFGLSQLHQLRGRIGRSDKKAYAYFIVPSHKKLSDIAAKRLKALQTYADLGSGLSLATSDLEIRGSGDILGAEQSGHIGNIGLELYMELLKECIQELKGEEPKYTKPIEIMTPFPAFIPKDYMENSGIRLKYYKKISNTSELGHLDDIIHEITDQYGLPPEEVLNLINIIKCRIYISNLGLKSVKVKTNYIILGFDKSLIESDQSLQNKIVNFFMQRPKIYKINPDYSINCFFKDKISINTLIDYSMYLNEHLN